MLHCFILLNVAFWSNEANPKPAQIFLLMVLNDLKQKRRLTGADGRRAKRTETQVHKRTYIIFMLTAIFGHFGIFAGYKGVGQGMCEARNGNVIKKGHLQPKDTTGIQTSTSFRCFISFPIHVKSDLSHMSNTCISWSMRTVFLFPR